MSKLPSFQFYPGDWHKDPGIRCLTMEERGVWFELILLMHESEERGKLVLNGKPYPEEYLANCCNNLEQAKFNQILSKILAIGIASKDEKTGIIFCRRILREENIRKIRSESGSLGGAPQNNQNASKKQAKTTPSSSTSSSSSSSTSKTTTHCETPSVSGNGHKPYKIETPLQKVVCCWKVLTGHKKDDRAWDKINWARNAKSAQLLLDYFDGDYQRAIRCMQELMEYFKKEELSYTLETILKWSSDWKAKNIKQEALSGTSN